MPNGREKISAFIVTRDLPGFSSGKLEYKMGIKGSNTVELFFQDVPIPAENLLGEVGKGFKIALEVLNTGRLSLAAGCVGGIKESIKMSLAHAESRRQFGKPIVEFEMIQSYLAEMQTEITASRHLTYHAARLKDAKRRHTMESAMAKYFAARTAMKATTLAVQILGGYGYIKD